jgi:hypothetical protein
MLTPPPLGNNGSVFDTVNNVEQVKLSQTPFNSDLVVAVQAFSLFSSYQSYALIVTGNVFARGCYANPDPTTVPPPTSTNLP